MRSQKEGEFRGNQGVSILLECIPLPNVIDRIQVHWEKTIKDIPARKPTLKRVRFDGGE